VQKLGIRFAMPGFMARECCPQLIFCQYDFSFIELLHRESKRSYARKSLPVRLLGTGIRFSNEEEL
jgi:hypothetical protein